MNPFEDEQALAPSNDDHRAGELVPFGRRRRFISRAEFAATSRDAPFIDAARFRADADRHIDQEIRP